MNQLLMRLFNLGAVMVFLLTPFSFAGAAPTVATSLVVTHYDLRVHLDPGQRVFEADAQVMFRNDGDTPVQSVPLMLYRLLRVQQAGTPKGQVMSFRQEVIAMAESENWQVNQVTLKLPEPVLPRHSGEFQLHYRGTIAGYPEVMQYVKDQTDERYSLFRAETLPYPVLGEASVENWRRLYRSQFTYDVRLTVPKDYTAVCGGTPTTQQGEGKDVEFTCIAAKPHSQLNIAVAKFALAEDSANRLRVYSLPEDSAAGTRVLAELKRALDFYTEYFGPRAGANGMNVIEIPDNWGSYTGEGFIFQSAAAFKDPKQNYELYHEVAHRWNAVTDPQVQRCRWFDEAFASYFEALALRALSGQEAYLNDLQLQRKYFTRAAAKDTKAVEVPIAEYGENDIGRYSYSKGAWSLYVLHQVLGEETFRRSIAQFLKEYQSKAAGFADFKRTVEQVSGRDLGRYFNEWIFGTESSRLLMSDANVETIAQRYSVSASTPGAPTSRRAVRR